MCASKLKNIKNILVVDDEPVIREVVNVILTGKGYDVDLASNGDEAIEVSGKKSFDLVISDVLMPGMNGMTFYDKAVEAKPSLKGHFIFLTGAPMEDTVAFFKKNDCDYLCKPFTPKELLDKIEEHKEI